MFMKRKKKEKPKTQNYPFLKKGIITDTRIWQCSDEKINLWSCEYLNTMIFKKVEKYEKILSGYINFMLGCKKSSALHNLVFRVLICIQILAMTESWELIAELFLHL